MNRPVRFRVGRGDLIAGVTVALILIPQALAYAEIAGVPAYIGLYAAALPTLAAAFFAHSRYLQTGPVAMTALLTFGALSSIAAAGSDEYVKLAALLALMVGAIRLVLGLVKAGVIAYLMSQPVLIGFSTAAAILIGASQLPTVLGSAAPDGGILYRAGWTIVHPGSWEAAAIVLAVVTLVLATGGRRISPLFPGILAAVLVGLGYSVLADYGGATVGDIPTGLPPFGLALPWSDMGTLLLPALVIALVGFAEPAAIARMFATRDRERWDPNREFISQGVANLASGISGGFPVGGSFSRTGINKLAGGRSRWSGAVTGVVVFAFLPVAFVLEPLPRAVLGAIVIAGVAGLIKVDEVTRIVRSSRPQTAVALVTFAATLAFSPRIERGILLGVGVGVMVHLWRELQVRVHTSYADGTLRVEPVGVLYFLSAERMMDLVTDELADHRDAATILFDLRRLGRIDYTGAEAIESLVAQAADLGLDVRMTGVPPQARALLERVFGGSLPNG